MTACVSAVMRSCISPLRCTTLDSNDEKTSSTNLTLSSEALCWIMTNGWPLGLTDGPWREWIDIISTSSGKCLSKAASSGALHEVCPPTMAPTFVA